VDVFVPGCPPRPDAIILGIAKAAEILAERGNKPPTESVMIPIVDSPCDGACACAKEEVQA
jgi:NADH:ubiquinone oxidoreductase subunit B-like Fe-S oxidoreductase